MTDWGIGDAGHPRFFCRKCGLIEYVQPYGRGFPLDRHQRIFDKMHKRAKCDGEREYRAGVAPGLRRLVERQAAALQQARELLQACRDRVKFEANSEGGIVARIDAALAECDKEAGT